MDNISFLNLSQKQQAVFIPAINACTMSEEEFKKKYNAQQIKLFNIVEICELFEENMSVFIENKYCRDIAFKIINGCERILRIQSEYINNELKNVTRSTPTHAFRDKKRLSNPNKKDKRPKIVVKEENDDDSVLFLSQEIDFNIEEELKVDENVEDMNLITEIEEPEEDTNIAAASYFGPALKDEIQFTWDNADEILDLNKSTTNTEGKYGVFARAEKQVLELLEHPTDPLPVVLDNDKGNFDDFPQRLSEALPKIPITPSKRKQRDQYAAESLSKRRRANNGTSWGGEALPVIVIDNEANFADFTHQMGEALSEIPLTPSKRKPMISGDLIETPSKRSRRSLNEQLQEIKKEPSDDEWILPAIEEFDVIKKSEKKKKKKKKPYLDKETTIRLSENVHIKTVRMETRLINPSQIVTPVEELFKTPSSLFAGTRKLKPISRKLLERFQYVVNHPPPPLEQYHKEFDENISNLQFLPPVEQSPSKVRGPTPIDNVGVAHVKADPGGDLSPNKGAKNDLQEITEPAVLDSKIKKDEFPIENSEMNVNIDREPFDITDAVDPTLPMLPESLEQNTNTIPIKELEGNASDDDDPNWDKEYVYQRIKHLCKGDVIITFGDLAPCAETKKMNRILAFEYILKLASEDKICIDQSIETEVITIWMNTKQ